MADMDALLSRAAEAVPLPDPDRFVEVVASRVRSGRAPALPVPPVRARRGRPAFGVAGAVVVGVVCALVGTLVGPVRSAVADFFGVDGVHITRASPLPLPSPTSLQSPTTSSVA